MSCEYSREEFKRDQLGQTGTDLSKLSERKPGPQEDCEACIAQRVHTAAETHMFHPFATHGYTKQQGYTDTRLKRFADERAAAAEKAKNAAATKK